MGIALSIAVVILGILLSLYFSPTLKKELLLAVQVGFDQPITSATLLIFCIAGLVMGIIIHLIPLKSWNDYQDQMIRLIPLIDLILVFAILTLILWFHWSGRQLEWRSIREWSEVLGYSVISGLVILLIVIFVLITRIGIEPDRSGWYPPGTPILFTQVILAYLIAGVGFLITAKLKKRTGILQIVEFGRKNSNTLICASLWLAAFLLWWSVPLRRPSYFSPTPVAPNYEYYPYSDGAEYDGYAQELLIGKGDQLGLIRRPLYAYFLASLHIIAGQDYDLLITLQIAVLALIPCLMYLLVNQLGNRSAGVVAAVLVILRERNSIALTNIIEVSHSKLLLSEVPAMGLMLLLCFLVIRWLASPGQRGGRTVLSGAVLGLLAMIRSQSLLLAPVILFCAAWYLKPDWRKVVRGIAFFILGLSVTIVPWMVRSQQIAGRYVIEDTDKYIDLFASGYSNTPYESISNLPGETPTGHYDRMVDQIASFITEHPEEVLDFYAAHFFHNEVGKIIYLPLALSFQDLRSYVNEMGFWKVPLATLPTGSVLLLVVNLGLMSLGIAAAYQKIKGLVSIPILISIGYSLSVVPARLSSGRFILPADWISVVFLSLGILEVTIILLSLVATKEVILSSIQSDFGRNSSHPKTNDRNWFLPVFILLVFGTGFALLPEMIPERFPDKSSEKIVNEQFSPGLKLDNGLTISQMDIHSFMADNTHAVLLIGSDLYPRYYKEGEYWGDDNPFNLEARKYDRLQFDLIGPQTATIFLPLSSPPESFSMGMDVMVIGCSYDFGVKALAVMTTDQAVAISTEPWQDFACQTQGTQP